MKYFVVEPLTLETSQGKVTLPAGKILELSQDQAARLANKVKPLPIPVRVRPPLPNGGRDLPNYCPPGDCWCSEKLPGKNYTAGCIRTKCEHHQEELCNHA